jgi:hypothetical protein
MKQITIRRMPLILSVVWAIALFAVPLTEGSPQSPIPKSGDLILELAVRPGLPEHYVASSSATWAEFFELNRLRNGPRSSNQTLEVGGIHIDYYRRGNTVVMDVDVFLGPINLSTCPPVPPDRIKSGGSYAIRAGESASLDGLAQYGVEPITVKVFATEWRTLSPGEITNKTKAIEVVQVDQFLEWFRIVLKNVSSKKIAFGKIGHSHGAQTFGGLAAGETREIPLSPNGMRAYHVDPSGRAVVQPVATYVSVTTIVFEDLTYEGDQHPALLYRAQRLGARIQATRITGLLQNSLDSHEEDGVKALQVLRQQISALRNIPDIHVLNDFVERFGPFTRDQHNELSVALMTGMSDTSQDLLSRMWTYEKKEASKGTSVESWLRTVKSLYEEMTREAATEKGKASG